MSDGELSLHHVPTAHVEQVWRNGGHALVNSLPSSECTPDQLKYRLTHGALTLLVALQGGAPLGYAAVEPMQYANMRVLHIEAVHAPRIASAIFGALTDYARTNGCTAIQGACSPAVSRLWSQKFGFVPQYIISRKQL